MAASVVPKFPCPYCGYRTLAEAPGATFVICAVCFWEDDAVQFKKVDAEEGANRPSLRQAQQNFALFGAFDRAMLQHVRPPCAGEERDADWRPLDTE